ncbi:SH2 domain-containing protein 7-like [Labrus mixtus]|uniref:SH2 domain-containing protein 7-like n=1 Tax=Labrus mixtus TaxID=508554 RepID=UPI0029BFD18C|nr:SH2 domain-containing protein 7-like [Labrus mixtus]
MSCVYISHVGSDSLRRSIVIEVKDPFYKLRDPFVMFSEMTVGSNHSLPISWRRIERNFCVLEKQEPRSERTCHFSGSRTKYQRKTKSPCLRTCLTFCLKERLRMEQRKTQVDSYSDETEGRLRELASKWFLETQVPFIVHNGFFPSWFLGFITRKDAEEILREKELGCFLIRLSYKAIGYILSYKGRDRCRHFVINQSESGQFVICGDAVGHDTVSGLIEYYKSSFIQPFGEYLTSSCFEMLNEDLYDIIRVSPTEKPAATVRDVLNVHMRSTEQLPARPPKSVRTQEEVPPLPRRSRNLDTAPLNDQDNVLYAQLRKQSPRERPRSQLLSHDITAGDKDISRVSPPSRPDSYSQLCLLDTKSRSLPLLDDKSDGDQSYRLSAPPHTPPRLSPRPVRQAASCSPQPERADACSRLSRSHSPELMNVDPVYHLAGRPGCQQTAASELSLTSEEHEESMYAEVSTEALLCRIPHVNKYKTIPVHKDADRPGPDSNTYEPLEDIRPKHNHSSWGLKTDKWKWLFPEARRK